MIAEISLYKYQIYIKKNWNKISLNSNQENNESNKINLDINNEDI